jgi:leader peptidase (prepilin peptidase)/N-methyltransferase
MEIDTRIIYPLSILIFIWKFSTEQIPIDNLQIISLLFLSVFTGWAFFAIQYFLTKKRGIGKGDLYLGIIMGLIFSWEILLLTIFLAYLIGTLVIIFLFILKGKSVLKSKLPLGAFLVPATIFSLIFPQQILYIYSFLLV